MFVCEWCLPKLQWYHATFSNFVVVILARFQEQGQQELRATIKAISHAWAVSKVVFVVFIVVSVVVVVNVITICIILVTT